MSTKNCIIPHEYWIESDPSFVLMKEGFFSGVRKRFVFWGGLSSKEAIAIWNADWESEEDRQEKLCTFAGKKNFLRIRRLVFEELAWD